MGDFETLKAEITDRLEYYQKHQKILTVPEQRLKALGLFYQYAKGVTTFASLKDICYPILAIMKGIDPISYQGLKSNPETFAKFKNLWDTIKSIAPEYFSLGAGQSTEDTTSKLSSSGQLTTTKCKKPLPIGKTTFDSIAGQHHVKDDIRMNYIYPFVYPGMFKDRSQGILFYGPPGTGKCLHPDEEVIMFNGTLKKAKHLRTGDTLMGDDSSPRHIFSMCTGTDRMYKLTPLDGYGDSFIVNEPHILSLMRESKPKVYPIKDGYKVVWTEDGQLNASIFKGTDDDTKVSAEYFATTKTPCYDVIDIELAKYMKLKPKEKAQLFGFRVSVSFDYQDTSQSPFEVGLTIRDIPEIPREYIINDRFMRLELLSGVLVAFGYRTPSKKYACSGLEIGAIKQLSFLGRSVGMNTKTTSTTIVFVCTDMCPSVPVERNNTTATGLCPRNVPNKFAFKITQLTEQRYFGFTLGGNQRFLLKDFTVTHNTMLARAATADISSAAFFAPSPGDLKGKYEGETEKNIRDLFACAAELVGKTSEIDGRPKHIDTSIIFLDEADSLVGSRSSESMARTTNAVLQAMDGIVQVEGVSVILATNFPWNIDPTVLRRLAAKIFVDKPDNDATKWLIEDSLKKLYKPPGIVFMENGMTEGEIMLLDDYDESSIDRILRNITTRSASFCGSGTGARPYDYEEVEEKETGWVKSTKEQVKVKKRSEGKVVDNSFIRYLVQSFGHSPKMGDLIEELENGTRREFKDLQPIGDYNPGYSASDITKVMSLAARKSSLEAMHGIFRKMVYYVKAPSAEASSSDAPKRIRSEYYVSTHYSELSRASHEVYYLLETDVVSEARSRLTKSGFHKIPPAEYNKCINFNLCPGHIIDAMKEYPSNIKVEDYYNLLMWKWFGVSPGDDN